MSKHATNFIHLDVAWVNAKQVNNSEEPDGKSLLELQSILQRRSGSQRPQYVSDNTLDFRLLEPRKGPIEKAVKVIMPLHFLGQWVLVSSNSDEEFVVLLLTGINTASISNLTHGDRRFGLLPVRRREPVLDRWRHSSPRNVHLLSATFGTALIL